MPVVEPGKKAPSFSLKDQDGKTHRLADHAGRPVILYFYPKDDTSGCTKEACEFRDLLPRFKTSKTADECICGEIVNLLPLAQSTVSQHLKELKTAGLITGSIDGPRSCYCINWKAFEKFNSEFNSLFNNLKIKNDKACC